MATIKACTNNDFVKSDGKSKIYFRIIHKKVIKYLPTDYYIEPKYLEKGKIKPNYRGHSTLNKALASQYQDYYDTIVDIGPEIRDMNVEQVVKRLTGEPGGGADFVQYTRDRIVSLLLEGRISTMEVYAATLKILLAMTGSEKIKFREITPEFLKRLEKYILLNHSANTLRNYMCNIRAIFNKAIADKLVKQDLFPFGKKYKIVQDRKRVRAIDRNDLRRLLIAQPYLTPAQQRDIDIFFLIFYTGGTNFKDLLYLKKEDYYKGRIIYRRFKTGREYSIKVFPEAAEIIKRYPGDKYLLPFIEKKLTIHPASRRGYEIKDLLKNTNKNLRIAGESLGVELRLKTYIARYSFATMASKAGVSKDVIAHILGHGEDTITDLYIDFDEDAADTALKKVIDAIKS
jgi:site-specific recombinase XerD